MNCCFFVKKTAVKNSLLFVCVLNAFWSFSQIINGERIEIDLKTDERISQVLPIGEKGFVTLEFENVRGVHDIFHISRYSKDFKKESSVDFERDSRFTKNATLFSVDSSQIVFLFSNRKEWILKIYDVYNQSLDERIIEKADARYRDVNYLLLDGKIVMSGYQKRKPTILLMDIVSGDQQFVLVPGISSGRIIESIALDNKNEKVVVLLKDGRDMKTATMHLLLIESNGEITRSMELDKDPKYSIIGGGVTWMNENSFLIAGTYGTSKSKGSAAGYYLSKWTDEKQDFITYHSFTDFETYLNYLPEKARAKMEKRVNRKKEKGGEDIIQSFVAVHPVWVVGNTYRIIGEVYYPTYRTESYTSYVGGKAVTSTRSVFDGYQYTHAAILDLDESGQKIKDYCFSIYLSNKPFTVIKNLRITENKEGGMRMMFSTGMNLKATTITPDREMTETDYGKIVTEREGDKVRYTASSCFYWYEDNYLVCGTQVIKNKEDDKVAKKRSIFFINKISYTK